MPKKQATCKGCGNKLKDVPNGNGYAHKKREHWTSQPHKAVPILNAEGDVPARASKPSTHDHHAPLG